MDDKSHQLFFGVVTAEAPSDRVDPRITCRGVRLTTSGPGDTLETTVLHFGRPTRIGPGALLLPCRASGHEVEVRVFTRTSETLPVFDVELLDRAGLASQLYELTLEYTLIDPVTEGAVPVVSWSMPHAAPMPETSNRFITGEAAFLGRGATMHGAESGMRIAPQTTARLDEGWNPITARGESTTTAEPSEEFKLDPAESRSLPHAILATPSSSQLGFGFLTHTATRNRTDAAPEAPESLRFVPAPPRLVQGETLIAHHTVTILPGPASAVAAKNFESDLALPALKRQLEQPGRFTLRDVVENVFGPRLKGALQRVSLGEKRLALPSLERAGPQDAWFTTRLQLLRLGTGLAASEEESHRTIAADFLTALLEAPQVTAAFPAAWSFAADDQGSIETLLSSFGHEETGIEDHIRLADAATTGYWMLQLSQNLPNVRLQVFRTARRLNNFALANQMPNGAFPAYFDSRYSAPRNGPFIGSPAESAAVARYLAIWSRISGSRESIAAARTALLAIGDALLTTGDAPPSDTDSLDPWRDPEVLAAQPNAEPRPAGLQSPTSFFGPAFAAQAIIILRTIDGASDNPLAELQLNRLFDRCLADLAALQIVDPRAGDPHQTVGGFRAHGLATVRDDPRQALAADVWLTAWSQSADRATLVRGLAALRASLANALGIQATPPKPITARDLYWGIGTSVTIAEAVRRRLGQVIVDGTTPPVALGVDTIWAKDLQIDTETRMVRLQLHSIADHGQARVTFHHLPGPPDIRFRVFCGATDCGEHSRDELSLGLQLPVTRLPQLRFQPSTEYANSTPFSPWAAAETTLGAPFRYAFEVEAESGEQWVLPLRPVASLESDPSLHQLMVDTSDPGADRLDLADRNPGESLRMRLVAKIDDKVVLSAPTEGWHRFTIGSRASIEPGRDDEHRLIDAGVSKIGRYPETTRTCRVVPPETSITYRISVPTTATALDLEVHGAGSFVLRVDDQPLLPADGELVDESDSSLNSVGDESGALDSLEPQANPNAELALRATWTANYTLADRRLWPDGYVDVSFDAMVGACFLDRVRFRTRGTTIRRLPDSTVVTNAARSDLRLELRIAIVPLSFSDAPFTGTTEDLRQAFFSPSDYRRTPPPNSKSTAGSVAELLNAMSGGLSSVRGEVAEPLLLSMLADDLASEPDADATLRNAVARHLQENLATTKAAAPFDAWILVHAPGLRLPVDQTTTTTGKPRMLALPVREPDGSFVSTGRSLAALLDIQSQLEQLDWPRNGRFGGLALTGGGRGQGHFPSAPASFHASKLGWADALVLDSIDHEALELPVLTEDRAYVELPCIALPDRGRLLIENRRSGPADPGIRKGGVHIIHDVSKNPGMLVMRSTGDVPGRAFPLNYMRVSSKPEGRPTPLEVGTADDLFLAATRLDGSSSPRLSTLQGEVPWELSNLRTNAENDGRRVDLHYAVQTLDPSTAIWTTTRTANGEIQEAPRVFGTFEPLIGGAQEDAGATILRPPLSNNHPTADGARQPTLHAQFEAPAGDASQRLFGAIESVEGHRPVDLSLMAGSQTLMRWRLDESITQSPFELDLPSGAPIAWHIRHANADVPAGTPPTTVRLSAQHLVPKANVFHRARQDDLPRPAARFVDGVVRTLALHIPLDAAGDGTITTSCVLPRGALCLRILGGLLDRTKLTDSQAPKPASEDLLMDVELRLPKQDKRYQLCQNMGLPSKPRVLLIELPDQLERSVGFLKIRVKGPSNREVGIQMVEVIPCR